MKTSDYLPKATHIMRLAAFGFAVITSLCMLLTGCISKKANVPSPVEPGPNSDTQTVDPDEPEDEPLDGLLFVSIGNNPSGRPQSGLSKAKVIFEAPAEGGITRLMAGFDTAVDKIGPVRSLRKPLVQITVGFDTPFAHCGGSDDSFEIIRTHKVKSLCAIYSAGECFWRSDDRVAPDNLYTSTKKIMESTANRDFTVNSLSFYPRGTLSGTPAYCISYNFSSISKYPNQVEYHYENSTYLRLINGQEHLDDSKHVLAPKALVFLQIKTTYPKGKAIEVDMDVTGEGDALFFSDGMMSSGKWKKPSLKAPIEFDIQGADSGLADGLLWIHLVPDLTQVEVK